MSRARLYAVLAGAALLVGMLLPYMASVLGGGLKPEVAEVTITRYLPYNEIVIVPPSPSIDVIGAKGGFAGYEELYEFLKASSERKLMEAGLAQQLPLHGLPWAPVATRPAVPAVEPSVRGGVAKVSEPGVRVSWTNVQVPGVDELDVVKTNGRVIAVVGGDLRRVYLVDVEGRSVASVIRLPGDEVAKGLFLDGWRLVIVSESRGPFTLGIINIGNLIFSRYNANVTVRVFDVTDPKSPLAAGEVKVSGGLVDGRLYSGIVYLIVNQPSLVENIPLIPLVGPAPITPKSIIVLGGEAERYVTVLALRVSDVTYEAVSILGGPATRIYMSYDRLYVMTDERPGIAEAYAIVLRELANLVGGDWGFNIKQDLDKGMVRKALDTANELLSSMNHKEAVKLMEKLRARLETLNTTLSDKTTVFILKVSGVDIKPLGSITVKGALLDQFAVEEYKGRYLLIATTTFNYAVEPSYIVERVEGKAADSATPTSTTKAVLVCYPKVSKCEHVKVDIQPHLPHVSVRSSMKLIAYPVPLQVNSSNSVYIVDVETLEIVGSLEGLAPGERVFSARLVKDIFFLVTFRVIDPLFAIDVSDPRSPEVLGFLKIPGFSEYLHPLPGNMLLGIGLADWHVIKVSLFDISNPTSMSEVSNVEIVGATSVALNDHRAVTVDLDYKRVYIPVAILKDGVEGIAVISFEGNQLKAVSVLSHPGASRSIYIGEGLYTISGWSITVYDIESLRAVAVIEFH